MLSSALNFELDDLLPLVEAGEVLGLANLEGGRLVLTSLGHTYAEASILARKELLAGRVLRLPLISWIYDTLQRDDTRSTARSYFLDQLEGEFGDLAEDQLDTAIRWGRHAELFAYNDDTGELYLEE
jgi:NitT/TauT family transport system ATP-binding protein